jgi:sterol desaturase/sphingolipid hydroxylase (fatty acid hydroxylase superfamily)
MIPDLAAVLLILVAMALVAVIETLVPLRARNQWNRLHLVPNLVLALVTFATSLMLNVPVIVGLVWLQARAFGILNAIWAPPLVAILIVVLTLDFAFYVAHVAMHKIPWIWRFHRVHHSDPAVDVTTAFRQHPVEGLIRYAFLVLFAFPIGASPVSFAVYRIWSALNALPEHANVRAPDWLDGALSLITTWPHMHKVHHSREQRETDSNYGNIFSIWDRLFGTFTPSKRGRAVVYGLEGASEPKQQTAAVLLTAPFRSGRRLRDPSAEKSA